MEDRLAWCEVRPQRIMRELMPLEAFPLADFTKSVEVHFLIGIHTVALTSQLAIRPCSLS
jgi:hypothetical protein